MSRKIWRDGQQLRVGPDGLRLGVHEHTHLVAGQLLVGGVQDEVHRALLGEHPQVTPRLVDDRRARDAVLQQRAHRLQDVRLRPNRDEAGDHEVTGGGLFHRVLLLLAPGSQEGIVP